MLVKVIEACSLSLNERISKGEKMLKCLEPNHMAKFCRQFVRCFSCGKAHLILCPELQNKVEAEKENLVANNVHTGSARLTLTPRDGTNDFMGKSGRCRKA